MVRGPGRLDHELHHQRRLAALAGPVARGEVLLDGDLLDALEGQEHLRVVRERRGLSHGLPPPHSRTPSQYVARSARPGVRRRVADVHRLVHVLERDLAPAEAADEADQRRPVLRVVQRRPHLVGDDARAERRPERVVAVDDPDGLARAGGRCASCSYGKGRNHRSRIRPTFLPCWRRLRIATLTGSDRVPMPMRTISASSVMYSSNHGFSGPRPNVWRKSAYASSITAYARLVASSFWRRISMTQSSFDLRRHGDRVVGVQQQVAAVVRGEEPVDQLPGRDLGDRLRVRQEGAVGRDRDRQEHPPVLGHPVRDQASCRAPPATCRSSRGASPGPAPTGRRCAPRRRRPGRPARGCPPGPPSGREGPG